MNYPMNADVHCLDGRYGRSTYIILNPASGRVIGLDLGGRTPGEIAVSVVAELIQERHGGKRAGVQDSPKTWSRGGCVG